MKSPTYVSLAVVGALWGAAPAALGHTDQETGAVVAATPSAWFSTPTELDGKTFANPHLKVNLRDNTPLSQLSSGPTSVSGSIEIDLALTPSGSCPSNPTGLIDIRIRQVAPDPAQPWAWKTTNWFDKSFPCGYAGRGETWHFDDSIGGVNPQVRDFELRLVDRLTGDVYLSTTETGQFVTPRAPSTLSITSTSLIAVNLRWQDNSLWDNHMEIQRAGEYGTPWTTIDRVTNVGTGIVYYQDYVPLPPSSARIYRYRVRAISGDKISSWTQVVATSAPSIPTGFEVTAEPRLVLLRWQNVYGEDYLEIERSQDGFATLDARWAVSADSTSFADPTTGGSRTYQYRLRAVNDAGPSPWNAREVQTPGLVEPFIPEFVEAVDASCSGAFPSAAAGQLCVQELMYEYGVYTVDARVCTTVDGATVDCNVYVLTGPVNPPSLPDDDDPSMPPPVAPDGTKWVPPHAAGESAWQWRSSIDDFPTRNGSWFRICSNGRTETLHWDSPHPEGKPDHWGYADCSERVWELPFDVARYGKAWFEKGKEWWL